MKFCFILSGLVMATLSSAQTWSLAGDFSGTQNPTGPWSYGWRSTITGTSFDLNDLAQDLVGGSSGTMRRWYDPQFGYLGVYKNESNTVQWDGGEGTIVPAGEVMLHPGDGNVSVARFTAPTTNLYEITWQTSRFGGPNDGLSGFSVVLNGVSLDRDVVTTSYAFNGEQTLSFAMTAGSVLDLVVDNNNDGDQHDSTGVRATIAAVPEPGSLAALGLGGLALLRRRRK